jgi:hypothetical protein
VTWRLRPAAGLVRDEVAKVISSSKKILAFFVECGWRQAIGAEETFRPGAKAPFCPSLVLRELKLPPPSGGALRPPDARLFARVAGVELAGPKGRVGWGGFCGTTEVVPCYKAGPCCKAGSRYKDASGCEAVPRRFFSLAVPGVKDARFHKAGLRSFSLCLGLLVLTMSGHAWAQSPGGPPPDSADALKQTQKNQAQKKSKVILSRSTDENGQTTDGAADPAAAKPGDGAAPKIAAAVISQGQAAEDAERSALTYTDFDLDVRLRPAESRIAVRALVTVRNDGKSALGKLPLQLSSTLDWQQILVAGRPANFTVAVLNSDADHTGQLHEAAVALATPLAAGASVQLDVTYSGTIAQSAKRLTTIGTPEDVAGQSDWDRISADFTGLRGFGNVVWYPVSSVPVILGDGARLFDQIGTHKMRLAGARFKMALTVESAPGMAPGVALVNGQPVTLNTVAGADASVASLSMGRVEETTLGFEALSLFVANRASQAATNATLWTRPESVKNAASWVAASAEVTPFLQSWLGVKPRSQLTVLELPEDGDIPFETGSLLATPVRAAGPEVLDGVLAHALTHAWVHSPRAWLSEGVAHFMGTLWLEKTQGRERALASLDSARTALALAEPESPGAGDGQPLVSCISPVYYRTKATYVFWMLRDLVGDATLSAALRAYDPAKDTDAKSFEGLVEQAGQRRDLGWFFADWVYADKGLPDLTIDTVFSTAASVPGSYLVAVNLTNNGYAAVEAPVQVISGATSVTQRVMIPGRGKTVQRILLQALPTEVRVNDGSIPETSVTIHSKTLDVSAPKP